MTKINNKIILANDFRKAIYDFYNQDKILNFSNSKNYKNHIRDVINGL